MVISPFLALYSHEIIKLQQFILLRSKIAVYVTLAIPYPNAQDGSPPLPGFPGHWVQLFLQTGVISSPDSLDKMEFFRGAPMLQFYGSKDTTPLIFL